MAIKCVCALLFTPIILFLSLGASAQSQTATLVLTRLDLVVGEEGQVNINIGCIPYCSVVALTIDFDSAIIQVSEVTWGAYLGTGVRDFFVPEESIDNERGTIRLAAATIHDRPPTNSNLLLQLSVVGRSAGNTPLIISSIELGDEQAHQIHNISVTSGHVAVKPPEASIGALTTIRSVPIRMTPDLFVVNYGWTTAGDSFSIFDVANVGSRRFFQIRTQVWTGWILDDDNIRLQGDLNESASSGDTPMLRTLAIVPMRESAITTMAPFRSIDADRVLPILDAVEVSRLRFYLVDVDGIRGWIMHTTNIELLEDANQVNYRVLEVPTATPVPITPTTYFAIVSGRTTVNLRAGPGTNFAVVDHAPTGTQLRIITDNPDELRSASWYLVRAPNGGTAYVSASVVRLFPPS